MRFRALCSALVLCAGSTLAGAQPYVIDFFPDGQQINHIIQLRFLGPTEGQITQSRLFIDFTTAQGFRAEDLVIQLVAPVIPAEPDGNFWLITGADLGWNGIGSFSAQITSDTLNGLLQPGLWGFDVGSFADPPDYSGTFSSTTRFEIDIAPIPEPGIGGSLAAVAMLLIRRRG